MTIRVKISDSAQPIPNSIIEEISIFFVDESANELLSTITYKIKVEKDAMVGDTVGNLDALVSSRRQDSFIFSFQDTPGNFPFFINSATGEIKLVSSLNSTRQSNFEVDALIQSVKGFSAPLNARVIFELVHISHQNRPKVSQDPLKLDIPENTQPGELVHQIKTENGNNNLQFAMLDQVPYEAFAIEQSTGKIKLAKQLDYETDKNFILTVRVTESRSQLSTFVTVIVNVMDINDNQPKIVSSDAIKLSSDVRLNEPFTRIVALDQDQGENGRLHYSILNGNDEEVFYINPLNGDLSLLKPAVKEYYLRIRVKDYGSPSQLYADQELHVMTTLNDYGQVKFLQSPFTVKVQENSPAGTTVSALKTLNGEGVNLNYQLLVKNDKFDLDTSSGQLKTQVELDREDQDKYSLVVSVSDQRFPQFSDTAIVNVNIEDLNDNDPQFGASCRDINIPENSEQEYIHTLIAYDKDVGNNGKLRYRLLQPSSPFSLDSETGRLSTLPLDRERQSSYNLEVVAEDSGSAQIRSASCLITVNVLDENDNEPSFSQSIYTASLKEDVPRGTKVLQVLASDPDLGSNAAVEYSIEKITHSVFTIDKETGAIYTTDLLDRESIESYTFDVVAMDGGKATMKSSRAVVKIIITDANDHTPHFDEFPFKVNMSATPVVGQPLVRLSASDADLGAHSQLTYNLIRPEQRALFELSPTDGVLSVIKGDIKWEPGTIQRLEVTVSDAGRPPRSSTGLVEVSIEGGPAITLGFQQETYHAELIENPASGDDVAKVHAVRSDGRRQSVVYTFLRGNEDGAFEINSNNGLIRVRDPEVIDFEKHGQFVLKIQGQGLGNEPDLTAYTTCIISIKDVNDNVPKFIQDVYTSRVLEGLKKSSVVTTLSAFDMDYEQSGDITYEIIRGNVDNAFYMTSAQPGVVLTNTVLDREVRDSYELTIAAKDNGKPSLTGTCKLIISILDANDSPMQFPIFPPFKISKSMEPGSLIATLRANDIDLSSRVSYSLMESQSSSKVSISTFTGQLYLQKPTKDWESNEINVTIEAFDGVFRTTQEVRIIFEKNAKDCRPDFSRPLFKFHLSLNATFPTNIGDLTADSCNGQENLLFSLISSNNFASIIGSNGTIVINQPMPTNSTKLVVQVQDKRSREVSTAVVVINSKSNADEELEFDLPSDTFELGVNDQVLQLKLKNNINEQVIFNVSENPFVVVDPVSGKLFKKSGQMEDVLSGSVTISARKISDSMENTIRQILRFFRPSIAQETRPIMLQEKSVSYPLTSSLQNKNIDFCSSQVESSIQILSGNDNNYFSLDSQKQELVIVKVPTEQTKEKVVIKTGPMTLCTIEVDFTENSFNGNRVTNVFPLDTYVTNIPENSPKGTLIMRMPLLSNPRGTVFSTNSKLFRVNADSGDLYTTGQSLDYESQRSHSIQIYAQTSQQRFTCQVQVLVQSVDEYPPVFSQDTFAFNVPSGVKTGYNLGRVRAQDQDKGSDGFISFSISPASNYFSIDPSSGSMIVKKQLDTGVIQNTLFQNRRKKRALSEVHFNVIAKSNKPDSLSSSAKIIFYINLDALPIAQEPDNVTNASVVVGVLFGLLLALIVLAAGLYFYCKYSKSVKHGNKMALLPSPQGTLSGPSFTPDQTLEMVGGGRYPPQYSEIMSDYERTTTTSANTKSVMPRSELSEKSHRSTSSGRGSVEDGDEDADVEIRMINEGNWNIPASTASGSQHHYEGDDRLSQASVQNTEEYLARLGIDIRKPPNVKLPEDPYSASQGGGTGSIYNRIPDDAMSEHNSTISAMAKPQSLLYGSTTGRQMSMTGSLSSIVHSEEELAGSYNWDYLLDWCPQYQNLAHVFKEISKLKDDDSSSSNNPEVLGGGPMGPNRHFPNFALKNPSIGNRLVPVRASQLPIAANAQDMLSQNALSPSFHPSLSPLATKSPSVSPMSVPLKRDIGPPRIGRGPLQ